MIESTVAVAAIALLAVWLYRSGKREGSRKGCHVGYRRGRRRRR